MEGDITTKVKIGDFWYIQETPLARKLYDEQMNKDGIFKREIGRRANGDKIIAYERDWNKKND